MGISTCGYLGKDLFTGYTGLALANAGGACHDVVAHGGKIERFASSDQHIWLAWQRCIFPELPDSRESKSKLVACKSTEF